MTNNKFTAPEIELIKFSIDLISTSDEPSSSDPLINTEIPTPSTPIKTTVNMPWAKVVDPFK